MVRRKNIQPRQVAADAIEITAGLGLSERNVKNLRKMGINPKSMPEEVVNMSFFSLGQIWHGVAIENTAGGFSFYTATALPHYILLGPLGLTVLPCEGKKPATAVVFVNIVDYMQFMTNANKAPEHDFHHCDCFVVEKPELFIDCLRQVSGYENIYCFFPPTDSASTMFLTMKGFFTGRNAQKKVELWNTKRIIKK